MAEIFSFNLLWIMIKFDKNFTRLIIFRLIAASIDSIEPNEWNNLLTFACSTVIDIKIVKFICFLSIYRKNEASESDWQNWVWYHLNRIRKCIEWTQQQLQAHFVFLNKISLGMSQWRLVTISVGQRALVT